MKISLLSLCLIWITAIAIASSPAVSFAAPFELSATAKAAFNKIVEKAEPVTAALLRQHYADLQTLQRQETDWDAKIKALHYRNESKDKELRKRIKGIDAEHIRSLQAKLLETEGKYKPLFDLYEAQKNQLRLAKALRNKELTSIVNAQVEITRIAVQAANKEIKAKEDAVKKAKSAASAKMSAVRSILSANEATAPQLKSVKGLASSLKKQFGTESKALSASIRRGDAPGTSTSLARLLVYERQLLVYKANHYGYEDSISAVLAQAEAKLLSYK
ncbi:hypothetical protein ACFQZE_16550 [Paenibacillus sp. GCM10027627]|uniref:hypothetical protein n=1 Tax=unclassified Paenibacillus TaxID=185978 RepID=UPI00363F515A